jgi:hypothetical protein
MGLFGNKKQSAPALFTEADFDEVANYSSTVAYLEGLSIEEYAKVLKVVGIRRKAIEDCAAALGEKLEPTTFINPPEPEIAADEPDFLDHIAADKSKPKGKKK